MPKSSECIPYPFAQIWDSQISSIIYYVPKTLTPNYKGATREKDITCVTYPLAFMNI